MQFGLQRCGVLPAFLCVLVAHMMTSASALPAALDVRAIMPASPGYTSQGDLESPAGGSACGFVETNVGDPDWVVCTSDRILRANRCVASPPCHPTGWYDKVFDPCYAENRYFKLETDSGSGFAYSMSALGAGSFDGLYIRGPKVFRLFSGIGDGVPFGPEMAGPQFVSIDHWRDVQVACDGFEPGTFFVTGGAGALGGYSLKVGAPVVIEELRTKEADNEKDHHTDKFADDYVLRRGMTFAAEVMLSEDYGPGCHDIYLEAKHDFDGAETIIDIPSFETPVPPDQWGAERLMVTTNGDKTKTVKVKITIPPDAAVGQYDFTAFARETMAANPVSEKAFEKPVIILFNPWSVDDDVYMPLAGDRDEYVLNENGRMWLGTFDSNSPIDWRFAQFDKTVLKVTLSLLNGVSSTDRSDPVFVSRRLSAEVNSDDGSGVLFGQWVEPYAGGTEPWLWSGSDDILKEFDATGSTVKFGQCWVFAGVLNTCLRCLGIPSRPVSNFESAHDADHPANGVIDKYFKQRVGPGGVVTWEYDGLRTIDSVWNFHAWCDAWMERPGPLNDGWQAVDATPQEPSDGLFRLGPASHISIINDSGGDYDVDFVVAEVDADVTRWLQKPDGAGGFIDIPFDTDTTAVGKNINTKAVGGTGPVDITASYKSAPAPSPSEPSILLLGSNIEVAFSPPSTVNLGNDVLWTAELHNTDPSIHTAHVLLTGHAISYNGTPLGFLAESQVTVTLDPDEFESVELLIPQSTYVGFTNDTRTLLVSLGLQVMGIDEVFIDQQRTVLIDPGIAVALDPSGPLAEGTSVNVEATYSNPFATTLPNAKITFSVGEGLSVEGNPVIDLGTVAAGEPIFASRTLFADGPGDHVLTVTLAADNLVDVAGYAQLAVFADCNANGNDDAMDISGGQSLDCNGNSVPDECEVDCDGNGSPDDCDLAGGVSEDCNANGTPDACDIVDGLSDDQNGNNVPDECERIIARARSVRTHGQNPGVDLSINLNDSNRIEPRRGGIKLLVFDMEESLAAGTVNCVNVQLMCAEANDLVCSSLHVEADLRTMVLELGGSVGLKNCCTITFDGMMTANGEGVEESYQVVVLEGDVNFNGVVSGADSLLIKPHLGEVAGIDLSAPEFDFDVSGGVTGADILLIKALFNNVAPACP